MREYLQRVTDGDSWRAIAARSGLGHSTLTRQMAGEVKALTIVAICRAYDAPVVPAFLAAGFLQQGDIESMDTQASLAGATDKELVGEILRRLRKGSAGPDLTEPVDGELI
ncbi:hypothetical protein QFZ50_001755 [Arthrobacter agilis]|nr:hypothetical protein [Arthrobacter agilis]